jgi:hypothetical protein
MTHSEKERLKGYPQEAQIFKDKMLESIDGWKPSLFEKVLRLASSCTHETSRGVAQFMCQLLFSLSHDVVKECKLPVDPSVEISSQSTPLLQPVDTGLKSPAKQMWRKARRTSLLLVKSVSAFHGLRDEGWQWSENKARVLKMIKINCDVQDTSSCHGSLSTKANAWQQHYLQYLGETRPMSNMDLLIQNGNRLFDQVSGMPSES